jgi:hypothetical protein
MRECRRHLLDAKMSRNRNKEYEQVNPRQRCSRRSIDLNQRSRSINLKEPTRLKREGFETRGSG